MRVKQLSTEATKAINSYVDMILDECLGEGDEPWHLGLSWRTAQLWAEKSCIAAAIIMSHDWYCDDSSLVTGDDRGKNADPRLCLVADELGIS